MPGERPSICLCMIVRDEVAELERCLDSCRAHIDRWVICDTGSTDGTQELIRRELAGIPGELHERPWVDFGHNRSELMRLARGRGEYLLLLDADWTIEVAPGALERLGADAYLVRHAGPVEFHNKRLVSGRLEWRYVGATHEYITCAQERTCKRLAGVAIHVHSVGGARTGRWRRDAELLEEALARDPGDARATFYLAQTYRDLGEEHEDPALSSRARELYQRRAEMGGWAEELYWARHQAGALSARLGEWPRAIEQWLAAWEGRPARLEALHALVVGLRERGLHHAAHRFTLLAAAPGPLPVPEDVLFVSPWIYEWGLLFEHSIVTYWCGEPAASIQACKRLLAIDSLPEAHRSQTRANLRHALAASTREAAARARAPRPLPHVGSTTGRPRGG
jgi:glycosyltransferase involved in cell wall biosynthesis